MLLAITGIAGGRGSSEHGVLEVVGLKGNDCGVSDVTEPRLAAWDDEVRAKTRTYSQPK